MIDTPSWTFPGIIQTRDSQFVMRLCPMPSGMRIELLQPTRDPALDAANDSKAHKFNQPQIVTHREYVSWERMCEAWRIDVRIPLYCDVDVWIERDRNRIIIRPHGPLHSNYARIEIEVSELVYQLSQLGMKCGADIIATAYHDHCKAKWCLDYMTQAPEPEPKPEPPQPIPEPPQDLPTNPEVGVALVAATQRRRWRLLAHSLKETAIEFGAKAFAEVIDRATRP